MVLNEIKDGEKQQGSLFVIATPIGNMEDITFRAVKVLSYVDLVVAENTRLTKRLLVHYGIKTKLLSMNEHNEFIRINHIIFKIASNLNVGLVSSAGTPLISDPGFRLICKAISNSIKVVPIPGVSALITSISVSGLPTDSFLFLGFPARKKGKRLEQLREIVFTKKTLVFYESPKRILSFLTEIIEVFGDRRVVLSREMTKIHEEFIRGKASYVIRELRDRNEVRGEFTLLIKGNSDNFNCDKEDNALLAIKKYLSSSNNISTSDLSKIISNEYGLSKNKVYNMIFKIKNTSKK